MKHYLQLVNFEINRFMKLYLLLAIFVGVVQTATVIFEASSYMQIVKSHVSRGMTPEQFINENWRFSLAEVVYTNGFMFPIIIAIAGLVFYMFFIWYRDWYARNPFVYRLLTLPTDRMNVYFAKLTTIMLTVFGMLAFQIIMLGFYRQLVEWIVPVVYRENLSIGLIVNSSIYLRMLIPTSFPEFITIYINGLVVVIVAFTIVLMERSYKWIGLVLGIVYAAVALILYALPTIIQYAIYNNSYLYYAELYWLEMGILALIVVVSLVISNYLIKRKVTV